MPKNQWAVSALIGEVLADPDLAHDDVFRRMLQDLIDAETAAGYRRRALRAHRAPYHTSQRQAI